MFMRVTGGRVKAACWDLYEMEFRNYVEALMPANGLRGRWLIRSLNDADLGFAITLWETRKDMEAFERSDALKREILPRIGSLITPDFVAHHCEIRHQEIVGLPQLGHDRGSL